MIITFVRHCDCEQYNIIARTRVALFVHDGCHRLGSRRYHDHVFLIAFFTVLQIFPAGRRQQRRRVRLDRSDDTRTEIRTRSGGRCIARPYTSSGRTDSDYTRRSVSNTRPTDFSLPRRPFDLNSVATISSPCRLPSRSFDDPASVRLRPLACAGFRRATK